MREEDGLHIRKIYSGLNEATGAIWNYLADADIPPQDISLDALQDFLIRIKSEQLKYNGYERGHPIAELQERIERYKKDHHRKHLIDGFYYIYREIINKEQGHVPETDTIRSDHQM